jgi:hypothetical protein
MPNSEEHHKLKYMLLDSLSPSRLAKIISINSFENRIKNGKLITSVAVFVVFGAVIFIIIMVFNGFFNSSSPEELSETPAAIESTDNVDNTEAQPTEASTAAMQPEPAPLVHWDAVLQQLHDEVDMRQKIPSPAVPEMNTKAAMMQAVVAEPTADWFSVKSQFDQLNQYVKQVLPADEPSAPPSTLAEPPADEAVVVNHVDDWQKVARTLNQLNQQSLELLENLKQADEHAHAQK